MAISSVSPLLPPSLPQKNHRLGHNRTAVVWPPTRPRADRAAAQGSDIVKDEAELDGLWQDSG